MKTNVKVDILFSIVLTILVSYFASKYIWPVPSPVVTIKDGKVQGLVSTSRGGKEFYEYLGIPFAKPPVGNLRFEDPLPAEPWEGVRYRWSYESMCLQYETFISGLVIGSEDCLYLNVFVPKERKGPLPVMVYLHGGFFQVGTPMIAGPRYLMDEHVILVTVAYRLGVLGFLSTGDGVVRGNMGLKDQNLALKWVQSNIESFGGDNKQVTIFGESAGGASVQFHVLSTSSAGLFQRAIHQSGSSLQYWTVHRNVKEQSKRYAKKFDCPTENSKEMIQCMKEVDPSTFIRGEIDQKSFLRGKSAFFVPTIEVVKDANAFLTEEPLDLFKTGRFHRVPILTGLTANEGLLISPRIGNNQTKLNEANDDWENWAPRVLQYPPVIKDAASKLRKFYFGDTKTPINSTRFMQNFTNMIGDRYFAVGILESIIQGSKFAPTFTYHLEHEGSFCLGEVMANTQGILYTPISFFFDHLKKLIHEYILRDPIPHLGTSHGDDVPLIVSLPWFLDPLFPKQKDLQISKDMVKLWADFAKGKESLTFREISVPKMDFTTKSGIKFLRISNNPAVISNHYEERRIFWKSLNIPDE